MSGDTDTLTCVRLGEFILDSQTLVGAAFPGLLNAAIPIGYRTLNPSEEYWVNWIKKWTYPNTRQADGTAWSNRRWTSGPRLGQPITNADVAAVVTWWALKEGIFDEPRSAFVSLGVPDTPSYLFAYSLCSDSSRSNYRIGPNQICNERCSSCWQVGISGKEYSEVADVRTAMTAAERIYTAIGRSVNYADVAKATVVQAGFSTSSAVYKQVDSCARGDYRGWSMYCANLIKLWLIRNHLVGFAVNFDSSAVCYTGRTTAAWCYGDWAEAGSFARGLAGVRKSVDDLRNYFSSP